MFYCLGSCRVNNPLKLINKNSNLVDKYLNTSKEIIQTLKNSNFIFNDNDMLIIEISTDKVHYYEIDNKYIYINNIEFEKLDTHYEELIINNYINN